MENNSLLYPYENRYRNNTLLNGLWKFQFDPKSVGESDDWTTGLPDPIEMPVPGSFADLFTDNESRNYTGDFWYEKEFYIPNGWDDQQLQLRFGSLTQRGIVYVNGQKLAEHEGGFLPVVVNIDQAIKHDGLNKLVVKLNNELSETSIPCGTTKVLDNGKKLAKPYFDFFNYSGIQRNVWLLGLPQETIEDYSVKIKKSGSNATVDYQVETNGSKNIRVQLYDKSDELVSEAVGPTGQLVVKNPTWWGVRKPYLYTIKIDLIDNNEIIDEYNEKIGIRTVEISGDQILINDEPVYLKGFGKHEDFDLLGKTFNWSVAKRDFELMKWTNANCFRTSHYPYAEEWYQFADREGFLIIDEVPAVGMLRSIQNFLAAGMGAQTSFFDSPTVNLLKKNHLKQIKEMMKRDKNHPSVFAWSLFNEPETTSDSAKEYFTDIFTQARKLDPQKRPLTGALEKDSQPDTCKCYPLLDFICLNRYYGWYISGGTDIDEAQQSFEKEMNEWSKLNLNVPIVFTEFGADTLPSEHKLPAAMWSQEYQEKYLQMNTSIFDKFSFVRGELVWCFADFQTSEGIMRVDGNRKGVFTREREPKDSAYFLKKRWSKI